MKWSWPGQRPSLKRLWSFETSGTIWRIVPLVTGRILGEVRRPQEKKASFFCLDETTGADLWKDREFDEPWWIGIEAAAHGILILHTYEKPDLPQHSNIIAVDVESGRELWRVPEVTFWFLTASRVYAYRQRFETRLVEELDLSSGEVVRTVDDTLQELAEIRRGAEQNIQTGDLSLPVPSAAGEDPELEETIRRWSQGAWVPVGVESLRLDNYLLVSYYLPTPIGQDRGAAFDNHFRVVDLRTRKLIHREILASAVPAPVPDTFYVRRGAVISIKDLQSLRAQFLPE